MHQVIRHLIFVPLNMRANIRRNSGWVGSRLLAQRAGRLCCDTGICALPAGMNHSKAIVSAGQNNRYAISEAEHDGKMAGGAYDGVRTLRNPLANTLEIACIRIPHRHHVITMNLVGNYQGIVKVFNSQRAQG